MEHQRTKEELASSRLMVEELKQRLSDYEESEEILKQLRNDVQVRDALIDGLNAEINDFKEFIVGKSDGSIDKAFVRSLLQSIQSPPVGVRSSDLCTVLARALDMSEPLDLCRGSIVSDEHNQTLSNDGKSISDMWVSFLFDATGN